MKGEVSALTTANSELCGQLKTSHGHVMELTIELGQLRDDVSRLQGQIQTKQQANGKPSTYAAVWPRQYT